MSQSMQPYIVITR